MSECCPYMGTYWDAILPSTVPDLGNRCYLRFKQVRVFWFVNKKLPGGRIGMDYQRATCYCDYRKCRDYMDKLSALESS
jgi:hypothetical protein